MKSAGISKDTGRNVGIDLLRIVSMIMIVTLHVLGHGGILDSVQAGRRSDLLWLIEILCYGAVNCFALISGYVYYGRKIKYSNIINLCFQASFYTVIPFAVKSFTDPVSFTVLGAIKALFPVPFKTFWFFSAYFCLFFFMPFINKLVEALDEKQTKVYIASGVLVLSFIPTLFHSDTATTSFGYSFVWLAFLYSIGAVIKKTGWSFKSRKTALLIFSACILFTWGSRILIRIAPSTEIKSFIGENYLVNYTSPLILLASAALFSVFAGIRPRRLWIAAARIFAPVSFGVYLFHDSPIVREWLITDRFAFIANYRIVLMIPLIVLSVAAVWLAGSAVDWVRILLFRLLRIGKLSKLIENVIKKPFGRLIKEK